MLYQKQNKVLGALVLKDCKDITPGFPLTLAHLMKSLAGKIILSFMCRRGRFRNEAIVAPYGREYDYVVIIVYQVSGRYSVSSILISMEPSILLQTCYPVFLMQV